MENKTRVFFVVSQPDKPERLFETLEDAMFFVRDITRSQRLVYLAMVEGSYLKDGEWFYTDPKKINHCFTIED